MYFQKRLLTDSRTNIQELYGFNRYSGIGRIGTPLSSLNAKPIFPIHSKGLLGIVDIREIVPLYLDSVSSNFAVVPRPKAADRYTIAAEALSPTILRSMQLVTEFRDTTTNVIFHYTLGSIYDSTGNTICTLGIKRGKWLETKSLIEYNQFIPSDIVFEYTKELKSKNKTIQKIVNSLIKRSKEQGITVKIMEKDPMIISNALFFEAISADVLLYKPTITARLNELISYASTGDNPEGTTTN
jgi:hypothetical protein